MSQDGNVSTASLTPAERRELLEEIGHLALTLGRSLSTETNPSGTTTGQSLILATPVEDLPVRSNAITSPYERLQLLLTLWTQLERPLLAILPQPDSRPVSATITLPLARLAPTPQTVRAITRSPRAVTAWKYLASPHSTPYPDRSRHPAINQISSDNNISTNIPLAEQDRAGQTPVSTIATTISRNTLPNRMLVSLLTDVANEATMLARLATFCGATAEAEQAQRLAASARQRRTHPALRTTPPLSDAEQNGRCITESLPRCAPAYRVVAGIRQLLHRPLDFDWTHSPLLSLPALESWHLYELWCYLQIATTLTEAGWHLLDGGELLRATPTGLRLTVATGHASRLRFEQRELKRDAEPDKKNLSLYYQPLFQSANQSANQSTNRSTEWFCSSSHAMQPDMAIAYAGRLILLDPKFKRFTVAEEAQEDIDKMHAYRDAITYKKNISRKNSGKDTIRIKPAISAAWCLFAGHTKPQEHSGLAHTATLYAYPTPTDAPTPSPRPYGTAGVGAFRLRPGEPTTPARLLPFLMTLLEECGKREKQGR